MQLVIKNQNQKKNAFKYIQERRKELQKKGKEKREDRRQAKEAVEDIMCKKAQTRLITKNQKKPLVVAKALRIG